VRNSFIMSSSATTKFQSALPFALLPISPSLSALHASRARSLNPQEFDPSPPIHCLQCGSYLLASDGSLELNRSRKRRKITDKKLNSIKHTCHRCGFISYTLREAVGRFPKLSEPTSGDKLSPSFAPDHKPEDHVTPPSPRSSTPASSFPVEHSLRRSTPKPKKKTMLHEMLVRNRETEVGRTKLQQKTPQSGLAAFLSSL
jgi:hypothetical protein